MDQRQKIFSVIGPIVGVILAYFVYTSMVDYLHAGQAAIVAEQEAGAKAEANTAAAPAAAAAATAI